MTETIEAAALCLGGKVYSLPKPARHDDVIQHMREQSVSRGDIAMAEQGFVTSTGTFATRRQARRIAERARQCAASDTMDGNELFSEDVW